MLELKVRALAEDGIDEDMLNTWDVERDGRWIYGTYFSGYILNGQGEGDDECFLLTGSWCPVKPETVGLYTGLKDMNGKKIFDGDICQLTNTYQGMNSQSLIEIAFEGYAFVGRWPEQEMPKGYTYNPLGNYNFPVVLIEVIGNIHEVEK